jgi:hypothetical protein
MTLSTEVVLTILGVLINLPPALLILWKIASRGRSRSNSTDLDVLPRHPSQGKSPPPYLRHWQHELTLRLG